MKTDHQKVWVNLQLEHVINKFGLQLLSEITKMIAMALSLKGKTCENGQSLNLSQSST